MVLATRVQLDRLYSKYPERVTRIVKNQVTAILQLTDKDDISVELVAAMLVLENYNQSKGKTNG